MGLPMVSVIIPTFNNALYIERAIDSVLIQDIPLEIIIVDDCSTDDTCKVVTRYMSLDNIKYIKNEINLGVAKSRNIGVENASGKYIAYLDADDWWLSDKLKKQLFIMEEYGYPLCYTARYLASNEGNVKKISKTKKYVDYKSLLRHNCIVCSSVMILKYVADEFPMTNDKYHEDYINWLMILRKYNKAYGIKEPLMVYRLSPKGKSRNKIKSIYMTFGVYKSIGLNNISATHFLISHLLHASLINKFYR